MIFQIIKHSVFLVFILFHFISLAESEEVFKWKDSKGDEYYSAKPRSPEDVPLRLPEIKKENLDERIKKIKEGTPNNCEQHGGIDCFKKADSDGSVICLDGYRDSLLPFRFFCVEARLNSDLFLVFLNEPKQVKHKLNLDGQTLSRKVFALKVAIRNLTPVEAFGIKVSIFIPGKGDKAIEATAEGADVIEPYGFSEYVWNISSQTLNKEQLRRASFRVFCSNCQAVVPK